MICKYATFYCQDGLLNLDSEAWFWLCNQQKQETLLVRARHGTLLFQMSFAFSAKIISLGQVLRQICDPVAHFQLFTYLSTREILQLSSVSTRLSSLQWFDSLTTKIAPSHCTVLGNLRCNRFQDSVLQTANCQTLLVLCLEQLLFGELQIGLLTLLVLGRLLGQEYCPFS